MPCSDGCYSAPSAEDRREFRRIVELLCDACQLLETTNTLFPHSLSVWWLNHKEEDRKRVEREMKLAETEKQKKDAIKKLTPHERKLLGVRE